LILISCRNNFSVLSLLFSHLWLLNLPLTSVCFEYLKYIDKVSPVDYKIKINGKTEKIFHVNMSKLWYERTDD
jgi:hypothetical protein